MSLTTKKQIRPFYNEKDIAKEVQFRIVRFNKKPYKRCPLIKNKSLPNMVSLIKKFIENKILSLIEYGDVYFGEKKMVMKRRVSMNGVEHDKKWNGYEYYAEFEDAEYSFSERMLEKVYEKVKPDWMRYG